MPSEPWIHRDIGRNKRDHKARKKAREDVAQFMRDKIEQLRQENDEQRSVQDGP